ncbi:MAG: caspase family protein [Spirochaetales bacterium]|nr:caspase family protein [Spirochaetales bacterium]
MRRIIVIALSILLLTALCSCELTCDSPAQGKMHIIVYGNDYRYGTYYPVLDRYGDGYKSQVFYDKSSESVGNASSLRGTVNDAYQVGLALCNLAKSRQEYDAIFMLGVESKSVRGLNATVMNDVSMNAFLDVLDSLVNDVGEDDITIIYFSGHGFGEKSKLPYVSDPASGSYLALRRDSDSTVLYPISKFLRTVESIPGTKILIGDFCYSGALVRAGNVSVTSGEYSNISASKLLKYRSNITESSSVYCLSASRYFEESHEPGDGSHGYFTTVLLEALGWDEETQSLVTPEAMTDNRITLFNIAKYVTKNDSDTRQTPMTSGGSNDIILFSF